MAFPSSARAPPRLPLHRPLIGAPPRPRSPVTSLATSAPPSTSASRRCSSQNPQLLDPASAENQSPAAGAPCHGRQKSRIALCRRVLVPPPVLPRRRRPPKPRRCNPRPAAATIVGDGLPPPRSVSSAIQDLPGPVLSYPRRFGCAARRSLAMEPPAPLSPPRPARSASSSAPHRWLPPLLRSCTSRTAAPCFAFRPGTSACAP